MATQILSQSSPRLGKMKIAQLRETLRARGLDDQGNKSSLVSRLQDAICKDEAQEMYFQESKQEEEEALEWMNAQGAKQRRCLDEEKDTVWGCGVKDARLHGVGYVKDFGKRKIAAERAILKQLEVEHKQDKARLQYVEHQLQKLVGDMKARKKAMWMKENGLRRKQKAIEIFQSTFT